MFKRNEFFKKILFIFATLILVVGQGAAGQDNRPTSQYADLFSQVDMHGRIRVLVGLNASFVPHIQFAGASAVQAQEAGIAQAQQTVANAIISRGGRVTVDSDRWKIPYLALEVDRLGLEFLASSPLIISIGEDQPFPALLTQSTDIIDAQEVWAQGYDGSGQTIVILDSGIQSDHPFYGGRVVWEACTSIDDPTGVYGYGPIYSLCPNGQETQTGSGAAGLDRCTLYGVNCAHGPAVAGIAAGGDGPGGQLFDGVARAANIIPIQVFSYLADYPAGNNVLSFTSPWVSSLNYVYDTLRFNYNIAAVNISIGSSRFIDQLACDTDSFLAPMKASIDLLRSVGIATIIASGNNYWGDGIDQPGCISSAVAVGATADNDKIAAYSNQNFMVDLLAPGGSPYSGTLMQTSIPGSAYDEGYGTSFATPHVSGAWAILKQAKPDASVGEILYILQQTGKPIIDNVRDWGKRCGENGNLPCSGLTYSRIDLDDALLALSTPFQNRFTSAAVTLTWNGISLAQGYEVQVDNNRDFLTPEFTGTTVSGGDLDIVTDPLGDDLYYWRVRVADGVSEWSAPQIFVVSAP